MQKGCPAQLASSALPLSNQIRTLRLRSSFRLSLFCWGVLVLESSPDFGRRADLGLPPLAGQEGSCSLSSVAACGPEPLRAVGRSIIAFHAWARRRPLAGPTNTLRGGHQLSREEWARNGDTCSPSLHFALHFHKWRESWRPTTSMGTSKRQTNNAGPKRGDFRDVTRHITHTRRPCIASTTRFESVIGT
jgi:hypothetical protein